MALVFTRIGRFSNTPALRQMTSSRKVFTRKKCIQMTWNDRINKGKRDSNVASLLKANIDCSGRMGGIVGSSSDTTHSAIKRATLFAGTQRQRILTTANAARNGRKMKISCCAKKSNAHRCSKKSLAPPKDCVKCWRKCQKWLPRTLQS